MTVLRFLAVATVAWVVGLEGQEACAQGTGRTRYEEQLYPTLSPWLKLYSKQAGPVDNYHSFVRPELQLRDTIRRQDFLIQQQTAGMSELRNELTERQTVGPVRPTGAGGVFMGYSHYYDMRVPRNRVKR